MNLSELMAKHAETHFEIIARDPDKQLEKLLEKIKGHAAPGHTFDVVVDPSMTKEEGKESFCMDGDGSFRIYGIDKKNIESTEKKDGEYKTPKAVFGGHDYWKKAFEIKHDTEKIPYMGTVRKYSAIDDNGDEIGYGIIKDEGDKAVLRLFNVDENHQNKGVGGKIISDLINNEGKDIIATPSPIESRTLNRSQLVQYYKNHGFEEDGNHVVYKAAGLSINTLEKIAATRWAKEMIKAGDNIVAGKNQAKNVNTFNNIMQNVVDKDSISPSTLVALKKGSKPTDTKGIVQFSMAKNKGNKGILAQQVRPATKDSLVPQSDKLKEMLPRATALHKADSLDDILNAYKKPVVKKNIPDTDIDNGGLLKTPTSALKYFGASLFGLI